MAAITLLSTHVMRLPANEQWAQNHAAARIKPYAGSERAIWSLITSLASMIDQRTQDVGGTDLPLAHDGYYYEHIKALFQAARAYLNFSVGRFDCGTLDRLILDLAGMAGLREDDV